MVNRWFPYWEILICLSCLKSWVSYWQMHPYVSSSNHWSVMVIRIYTFIHIYTHTCVHTYIYIHIGIECFITDQLQPINWIITISSGSFECTSSFHFKHGDELVIGAVFPNLPVGMGSLYHVFGQLYIQTADSWGSYWVYSSIANTYYRVGLPMLTRDGVSLRYRLNADAWDISIYPMWLNEIEHHINE